MKTLGFAAIALALTAAAHADPVAGLPVHIAQNNTEATLVFVGSDAAWTGELYWIDDGGNLVGPIFNNHASLPGDTYTIPHLFDAGDDILFAYDVLTGEPNLFRMDGSGAGQFASEHVSAGFDRMFIEDIMLPGGDKVYNDNMFDVYTRAVPTPGSFALLGLAGLAAARRRRD
jgi:MYXO-CTERM domain-containing protein